MARTRRPRCGSWCPPGGQTRRDPTAPPARLWPKPAPMEAATWATVTGPGNSRLEPSGNSMEIMGNLQDYLECARSQAARDMKKARWTPRFLNDNRKTKAAASRLDLGRGEGSGRSSRVITGSAFLRFLPVAQGAPKPGANSPIVAASTHLCLIPMPMPPGRMYAGVARGSLW